MAHFLMKIKKEPVLLGNYDVLTELPTLQNNIMPSAGRPLSENLIFSEKDRQSR
jgi:hypothetical protein